MLNSTLQWDIHLRKPCVHDGGACIPLYIYTKLTQYKVGSKCEQAIVYKQSCVNLKKFKDSILFQPCTSMHGKVWELSLHAVLKRLLYTYSTAHV